MGFLHSKWAPRRPILLVGLTTLLLFVVGPQLGSLDADADGIPEIPVALASTSTVGVTTFTCLAASHRTTRNVTNPIAIAMHKRALDTQEHAIASPVGWLALRSFCPLRC